MTELGLCLMILMAGIGGWVVWRMWIAPQRLTTHAQRSDPPHDQPAIEEDSGYTLKAAWNDEQHLQEILLYNDATTPMEFVLHVLETVFEHSPEQAFHDTIAAHAEGEWPIATLPEVAAQERIETAQKLAHDAGLSLRFGLRSVQGTLANPPQ